MPTHPFHAGCGSQSQAPCHRHRPWGWLRPLRRTVLAGVLGGVVLPDAGRAAAGAGAAAEPGPAAPGGLIKGPGRPWRDALEVDASNAAAARWAAGFLEQAEDADAVEVWRQIVFADPARVEHRVGAIHAVLRAGQLPTAERGLAALAALAPGKHAQVAAEAAVAFASNYSDVADDLLNATGNADTGWIRRHQAVLRLRLGNRAEVAAARRELRQQLTAPAAAREIRVELLADALRHGDDEAALRLGGELSAAAEARFDDRLREADLWLFFRRKSLAAAVDQLAPHALNSPDDASALAQWLIARGHAEAADSWIDLLPSELVRSTALREAHADCIAALGDWDRALPLIAAGAWGEIANEPLRRLLAAREITPRRVDHAAWERAIAAAARDPGAWRALYRLAVAWKREPQRQALLWAAARGQPSQGWAFQALADEFNQQRNTARLLDVYAQWHRAEPDNLTVQANAILLTLLTSRRPSPELRATIDELAQQHPRHALIGTVRALSLWQQDRAAEALVVTEHLRSMDRRMTARAFYHGLFVAAAGGRVHEAEKYLLLSAPARLLPEEEKLVRLAQGMIARISASE